MSLVNGGNDLTEKRPRLRFSQPPSRPDIGMEVGETGRKEEVGLSITHYHFVNGVDVWVTVNPVVGCQHSATDWIVIDNLECNVEIKLSFLGNLITQLHVINIDS
jgi:hypothetical protein